MTSFEHQKPAARAAQRAALIAALLVLSLAARALADFQGATHLMPFDEDTINYNKTPPTYPTSPLATPRRFPL